MKTKPHELTLLEAYRIGAKEAQKWDVDAKLTHLTSVDEVDNKGGTLGITGKRITWNMIFGNSEKKQVLIINVKNGRVEMKHTSPENVENVELISPNQLTLDSPYMASQAKLYKLKPGEVWAKGYHFTITKDEKGLFFAVVGLDEQNKFTKLYFNSIGKLIGKETKNNN